MQRGEETPSDVQNRSWSRWAVWPQSSPSSPRAAVSGLPSTASWQSAKDSSCPLDPSPPGVLSHQAFVHPPVLQGKRQLLKRTNEKRVFLNALSHFLAPVLTGSTLSGCSPASTLTFSLSDIIVPCLSKSGLTRPCLPFYLPSECCLHAPPALLSHLFLLDSAHE